MHAASGICLNCYIYLGKLSEENCVATIHTISAIGVTTQFIGTYIICDCIHEGYLTSLDVVTMVLPYMEVMTLYSEWHDYRVCSQVSAVGSQVLSLLGL